MITGTFLIYSFPMRTTENEIKIISPYEACAECPLHEQALDKGLEPRRILGIGEASPIRLQVDCKILNGRKEDLVAEVSTNGMYQNAEGSHREGYSKVIQGTPPEFCPKLNR